MVGNKVLRIVFENTTGKGDTWLRIDHFKISILNRKTFFVATKKRGRNETNTHDRREIQKANSLFR
jgi:hypothetical protein